MRPIATRQSNLGFPLNKILGTEANVRILRVLAGDESPRTVADLALSTGISLPGVRSALRNLEESGVIEVDGRSRGRRATLRPQSAMFEALRALFYEEERRAPRLWEMLRGALSKVDPPLIAAWVAGPHATGLDAPNEPVVVVALGQDSSVDAIRDALSDDLANIERTADVLIEIRPVTRADLRTVRDDTEEDAAGTFSLLGPAPDAFLTRQPRPAGRSSAHDHAAIDERSLRLGRLIAQAMVDDPSILGRARATATRELERASVRTASTWNEWVRVLNTSPAQVRRFLVDPGERATRLRQSSPFLAAFTPDERKALLAAAEKPKREGS